MRLGSARLCSPDRRRWLAVAMTVGVLAAVGGCGGGSSDSSDTSASTSAAAPPATTATTPPTTATTPPTTATTEQAHPGRRGGSLPGGAGKIVFRANCAGCHTLALARTSGTEGPNLDELKPARDVVLNQVTNGGGGMPPFRGTLTAKQIKAVAAYVEAAAGLRP